MRGVILTIVAVATGLLVVNMLGIASAEAPTGSTAAAPRTVGVQGVATVPLEQGASAATATGVYRQAMADAIADGHSKAEYLASKVGVALGGVQSVTEGGGSIGCKDDESQYVTYEGEQPDFGHPQPTAVYAAAPAVRSKLNSSAKRRKASAKRASVTGTTCTLASQVSLVYLIE
jgi:hypothetical protein